MRSILALVLTFHFVHAPVQAQVGEQSIPTPEALVQQAQAQVLAQDYALTTQNELAQVKAQGWAAYLKKLGHQTQGDVPALKPTADGWEMKVGEHRLSFGLVDVYHQQVWFDGKVIKLKGLSPAEIEAQVLKLMAVQKTSSFWRVLKGQLWVEDAHAMEPLTVAVIGVVAIGLLLYSVNELIWRPEKFAKRVNSLTRLLQARKQVCEGGEPSSLPRVEGLIEASELDVSQRAALAGLEREILQEQTPQQDCAHMAGDIARRLGRDAPNETTLSNQLAISSGEGGILPASGSNVPTRPIQALVQMCHAFNDLKTCVASA